MKKALALMLSLLLIATLFVGCSGGTAAADEIKLGWVGSLTGDQAVWGTCERDTLTMLIDEVNKNGGLLGKQIKLIPYDSQGKPEEALNAAKRLIEQDGVVSIIGPNASKQVMAMAPALEAGKVPDIATVATNPKVTVVDGKVRPYNFRVCFIDPYQGAVAAGYAFEKLGKKNAAILYDNSDEYSVGLTEFFEKTFTEMGGTIVAKEAFNTGDTEFKTQLTKIKAANPDILFMPYFFKEVALTANQAKSLGMNVTMMGGDGWPSEQLMQQAKDAVQGSYFVNHLDYEDPDVAAFNEQYKTKYGKLPELNGYLAYDALEVFMAAVKAANSTDPVKIAEALKTIEVKGITGNIKIDPETHNPTGKPAAILKIEGDKYVFQEKYAAPSK